MSMRQPLSTEAQLGVHSVEAGEAKQGFTGEIKAYYAALLFVLLLVLAPIWIVKYPGMVDFPNHLTRCYILAHYYDNPIWQQRFIVVHDPLPNLAIDLIVTPLVHLLPLILCGKIFLSISAALYVIGCSYAGRAITGKPNWLALVCALTFYNSALLFGFVNYIFGVGVFLCAFAYWLRVRNAMTPLRFSLCCLLSFAAFFAHLSSIAFLGLACVTIALLDFIHDRRIARLLVKVTWLACPVLLMAAWLVESALHSPVAIKNQGHIPQTAWRPLSGKLTVLLTPVRSYSMAVDLGVILLLLVCALAIWKGSKVHRTAVVSLILYVLFLITPSDLYTTSAADARYVLPGFLLLLLSIELRWGRRQKIAVAVALAAMAVHIGSITADWLTISRRSEQVMAMGEVLPDGARIYVFQPLLGDPSTKRDRGFFHQIQFWTISRNADISTLFTFSGQQPLLRRQPVCDNDEWKKCIAGFDYIWTYNPPAPLRQEISRIATPASTWEKVTLWRIDPAEASTLDVSANAPHPN